MLSFVGMAMGAFFPIKKAFLVSDVIFDTVIIVLFCDFRLVVLDGKIRFNISVKSEEKYNL